MAEMQEMVKQLLETNVATKRHRELYPTINPTRPELSQAHQVVLVTGGGTGFGYGIAKTFVLASADTVIIIGRRLHVLEEAASNLEAFAKEHGSPTKILKYGCDITNAVDVKKVWDDLASQKIAVDVLVSNVAKFTEPKPLLELGADEPGDKQKFIVNVSTQATHMTGHPGVAARPAYTLSKMSGTLMFQLIAQNTSPEKLQVVSFHPGLSYNEQWEIMGFSKDQFDNEEVAGGFAVWAATKQAQFLHGRFVWSSWDVDELSTGDLRKRIDEDVFFLRSSIVGLNGGMLA